MAEICDSSEAVERYLHVLRRRNPRLQRRHSFSEEPQHDEVPSRPCISSRGVPSPLGFLPPRFPREDGQRHEEKDVLEAILGGGPISPIGSEPRSLPDRMRQSISPSPRFSCDAIQSKKRLSVNFKRPETDRRDGDVTTPRTASSALGRAGLALALGGPRSPLHSAAAGAAPGASPMGAPAIASNAKQALAIAASAAVERLPALRAQQVQVQLLLQRPDEATCDDASLSATLRIAEESLELLKRLAETAKNIGITKGQLWRWLLPCNSDTSIGNPPSDYASVAAQVPLGSAELDGILPASLRRTLVKGAVVLRQFIRVKVNDCADMDQACDSLRLIIDFINLVQQLAAEEGASATSFLANL